MADLKADDTGNAIVPVLACVLNQLCIRNDRLPMSQRGVSKFHALRPPAISIRDYLARVAKYAACSGECFVLALVYIDRIIQSNPQFVVNSLNIHRLLITSIMLAAKFFDDQYFNNAYYAKVGGVPCTEINSLEVEFLFLCNFALFVNTETYSQYYTELCNHAANVGNVCSCSQGPRVPQLLIPQYAALSQPPQSLEGHVYYPVRGEDAETGRGGQDDDTSSMGMEPAAAAATAAIVRGGGAGMQHASHHHAQQQQQQQQYAAMAAGQQQQVSGYYYHHEAPPGYAVGYPPAASAGVAVHPPPGAQPLPPGVQQGGAYFSTNPPHPAHALSRTDARPGSASSSGDPMISSPQVGVM